MDLRTSIHMIIKRKLLTNKINIMKGNNNYFPSPNLSRQ